VVRSPDRARAGRRRPVVRWSDRDGLQRDKLERIARVIVRVDARLPMRGGGRKTRSVRHRYTALPREGVTPSPRL
jgi:hypothetical protein